jgi:hypothetical protein
MIYNGLMLVFFFLNALQHNVKDNNIYQSNFLKVIEIHSKWILTAKSTGVVNPNNK